MDKSSLEKLREWLAGDGFQFQPNPFGFEHNECNWLAYRYSSIPARPCACNEDKPAQIVVRPCFATIGSSRMESVEVDVCGEAGGLWFDLKAYSIKAAELPGKLPAIEAALIRAWNALAEPTP